MSRGSVTSLPGDCRQETASLNRPGDTNDEVTRVPISSLVIAESPRVAGVQMDHARTLAESGAQLPPILVHRKSMRVIDGAHRVLAAKLGGRKFISARFFDGDDATAFVVAVQANVTHGLPLTHAERVAAATRIVNSHPQWSDRLIASHTGLSPKTVGAVRSRSSEEFPQSDVRVGRDGRVRRISDRVRDKGRNKTVDERPVKQRDTVAPSSGVDDQRIPEPDHISVARVLRKDPSLRSTSTGRMLLRLLDAHLVGLNELDRIIADVPPHCASRIPELARDFASAWQMVADRVETDLDHFVS